MGNERGAVFPLTLMIVLIALLIASQTVFIFMSQYGYLTEIRNFYKQEGERLLNEPFPEEEGRDTKNGEKWPYFLEKERRSVYVD
ncbi:hypothetical protein [Siminovitchia sp. 179-K 8D1 HS]|uniref:hypothetical protein n=1 Tax=Siminovitchia sp. 179-K 8D1 HS TaxID=3142385 RepID=UPI0039A295E5